MISSIFVLFVCAALGPASCKRYDVDAECQKMYGEDLRTVVLRFRRTPAYLTILRNRIEKLRVHLQQVMLQEFSWYSSEKLGPKVAERFPRDEGTKKPEERRQYNAKRWTDKSSQTTSSNSSQGHRKMDGDGQLERHSWQSVHPASQPRRDNAAEGNSQSSSRATPSPVVLLDEYKDEDSNMTASDVNEARNIGFEAFGDVIHNIITDMGGQVHDTQSTQQPAGGSESKHSTPTTHAQQHTVGESEDEEKTKTSERPPTDRRDKTRRRKLVGLEFLK